MKTTKEFEFVETAHTDLIHDVAYDFCGKKLATCSSDQKIKLWEKKQGKWVCFQEIEREHYQSIHRLAWSHPKFGNILASCSSDRTVHIFEECVCPQTNTVRFLKKATLLDSRGHVKDCKFSPAHHNLKLATGSVDGSVRIYEARDVMNLSHWSLMENFEAGRRVNCLDWNKSRFDVPTLAVGTDNGARVWAYSQSTRQWKAVTDLVDNIDVLDIGWAPHMGRRYHLIAVACRDKTVRIFKMFMRDPQNGVECKEVATLECKHPCWRVSWNMTGTMLASSGDDGYVRLWKAGPEGKWHSAVVLAPPAQDAS